MKYLLMVFSILMAYVFTPLVNAEVISHMGGHGVEAMSISGKVEHDHFHDSEHQHDSLLEKGLGLSREGENHGHQLLDPSLEALAKAWSFSFHLSLQLIPIFLTLFVLILSLLKTLGRPVPIFNLRLNIHPNTFRNLPLLN